MSEPLHTVHQAAARLGLHPKTVLRFIRDGRLRATRIGKSYRIAAADLDAFSGADKAAPAQVGAARVTAMVEIDAIAIAAAERLATILNGAVMGREAGESPISFGTSYEPRAQRLRIMLTADAPQAASLLHLIELQRGRS